MVSVILLRSGNEFMVDDELEDLLVRIDYALRSEDPHGTVRCRQHRHDRPEYAGLPAHDVIVRADSIEAVTGAVE